MQSRARSCTVALQRHAVPCAPLARDFAPQALRSTSGDGLCERKIGAPSDKMFLGSSHAGRALTSMRRPHKELEATKLLR